MKLTTFNERSIRTVVNSWMNLFYGVDGPVNVINEELNVLLNLYSSQHSLVQ